MVRRQRDRPLQLGAGPLLVAAMAGLVLACEARAQHRVNSPVAGQLPMSPGGDDFSPAAAHPPVAEAPRTDNPCTRPESEEALLACEHREFDRAEEAIQRREAALQERFGKEPGLLEALATAQANWREFRDAECVLDTYDSRGGTAFESYWIRCQRELDWQRASRLQFLLDNP